MLCRTLRSGRKKMKKTQRARTYVQANCLTHRNISLLALFLYLFFSCFIQLKVLHQRRTRTDMPWGRYWAPSQGIVPPRIYLLISYFNTGPPWQILCWLLFLPVVWSFPSNGLCNQPCKTGLPLPNVHIWEEDLLYREKFMDPKLPFKEITMRSQELSQ